MQPEEVLGLRPGASPEACRAAYRRLVRVHHPDTHPSAGRHEREAHAAELRLVMAAWEALGAPEPSSPVPQAGQAETGPDSDDEPDDLFGPEADIPLSPAGAGRAPVMIAMGLVAASFLSFCVSVVMSQTALWQLSLGLGFAALVAFILLPFFVMLRGHR